MESKDSKGRFIKGFSHNKGRVMSDETKLKISIAKKGKRNSINTEFSTENTKGDKHWNWKGGQTKAERNWIKNGRNRMKRSNGGCHTYDEWEALKLHYGYECPCCKKREPEIKLTEDHIVPVSKGGTDNIENIQPLCLLCNIRKHTKVVKYIIDNRQ